MARLRINQDPGAFPPRLVAKVNGDNGAHQVWVRPLQNGDVAVALINTGSAPIDVTVQLRGVLCASCGDEAMVEDVWAGEATIGSAGPSAPTLARGSYTAKGVRAHETVLLRLSLVH